MAADFEGDALARVLVDDRQHAQLLAVGERVAHEVHAPAFIRPGGRHARLALHRAPAALGPLAAQIEAIFFVESVRSLRIDVPTLPDGAAR